MRLSPELSLQQKFTLSHVQLMELLLMQHKFTLSQIMRMLSKFTTTEFERIQLFLNADCKYYNVSHIITV